MKRIILLSALGLLFLSPFFAGETEEPSQFYAPAHIGLYLPDDTEVEEEDGVWYAYSESAEIYVSFEQADTYVAAKDISEETLTEAFVDWDIEDFVFLSIMENEKVTYAYGQGMVTDEEGNAWEGFFGIITNADVKKRTFMFSLTAPTLMVQKSGEPAQRMVSDMPSMAAPKKR